MRILRRLWSALRRLLEQRAGMPTIVPPAQPAATAQPPRVPLEPFGEFDLEGVEGPDPDAIPTVRESVRAKAMVPGPQPPQRPFPHPPPPIKRRGR